MDANKKLVVLAPNGHRQTVKVTPNTTILQIIEEVCKKQGFKPEEFDIKHHRTVLDTSTTIQFSGLPNNAQLELLAIAKARLESAVIIAVQLENGNRPLGNFSPGSSLWEILIQLCPEEVRPDNNLVVIYTRQEIAGINSLQNTTLRSLGLTSGRAVLRLIHKSPEELRTQANISAPLPSRPVEEKPYIRKLIKEDSPPPKVVTEDHDVSQNVNKPPEINNVDEKHQKKHKDSVKQEKRKQQESPVNEAGNKKVPDSQTPAIVKTDPAQTATARETTNVNSKETPENFVFEFLGERNAMLFSLETAQAVPSDDLPDDFFELTITDAKKLIRDMKQKRLELENAQLLTSTIRKLRESSRELQQLHRYKKSVIRIFFPDQTVLQGTFSPVDTVGTVLDFVREFLEDKSLDFYLYTTPPKHVLNRLSRLVEIGCVPNAVLHFGTKLPTASERYLRSELLSKFTTASVASLAATKMRQEATRPMSAPQANDFDAIKEDLAVTAFSEANVGASTSKATENYQDYADRTPKPAENLPKWFKPKK